MKNIIMMMGVGLLLFGVSAGGAFYFQNSAKATAEAAGDADDSRKQGDSEKDNAPENKQAKSVSPLVIRSDQQLSAESLLEINDSVVRAEKNLQEKALKIRRDEARAQLLFEDLKREREELLAFEERINAKLDEANLLLSKLDQRQAELESSKSELDTKRDQLRKDVLEVDSDRSTEAQKFSKLVKSFPAEEAATYIESKADAGEFKLVAEALNYLRQRDATKILSALNDKKLAEQIITLMTKIKPPNNSN